MTRFIRICALLSAVLLVTLSALAQAPPLTPQQRSWLDKAVILKKHGWIYLHIEGAPRERGFQHGYLLAEEIREGIRIERTVWEYESAMEWSWLVGIGATMFTAPVDSEFLAEIDGIAEGMQTAGVPMTREELLAYNASIDLIGYWWPTVKDSIAPNAPVRDKESCSSFIATGNMTTDGRIVLGHNTWSRYPYATFNVIIDILPARGHRILMQTSAGLIHSGSDFFITGAGLVGSETTIDGFFPFDPAGVPEFVRMRKATQYASTIDEWCSIMKVGNNGGYANAWLLGDLHTNEIARLELGLRHVGFERTKDGWYSGSNIAENLQILRKETTADEENIKDPNIARRVRWKQLMKKNAGKIDAERAKAFLADHVDTWLGTTNPGSRSICGHGELDAQIAGIGEPFDPRGAYDAKVVDARMAGEMSFLARWGAPCGTPFDAARFLEEHPQYEWMAGLLKDRPTQPWTAFRSGER